MKRTITIPADIFQPIVEINSAFFYRHSLKHLEDDSDVLIAEEEAVVVPNATYSTLVSAFIHTKYSIDDELAILANHATDPTDAEHLAIYNEYQAWRKEVKTACREYFNIQ